MTVLEKLIRHFEQFPGVGVRQARRFAFHTLTLKHEERTDLANSIATLSNTVSMCTQCQRFFTKTNSNSLQCTLCTTVDRNDEKLLIVAQDSDIDSIERSGVYNGRYFVLGGTVPLLEDITDSKLRSGALKSRVANALTHGLNEIIVAFAINPEGENTERYVRTLLTNIIEGTDVTITHLGRGLSTGSELEYADAETLKYALKNRY